MKSNVLLKKGWAAIFAAMLFLLSLIGCGQQKYPPLPEDAIAFEMGSYEDTAHDDALFGTIEYSGRVYVAYGTISSAYRPSCAETCIGYIIQDENSSSVVDLNNKDRRVYIVAGDPDQNFLLEYDATIKLMNSPAFYRALDTIGQEIEIPACITPLDYELWQ